MSPPTPREGPSLRQLSWALVPVALGLALLWGWILPEVTKDLPRGFGAVPRWDLENYFLPKFVFGSQEFARGVLPVWNRFEFAGYPLLAAAQPSALYPPKVLIFALLSPESALPAYFIFHYLLAALCMGLLLRDQRLPPLALAVGAIFYCFSITMLGSLGHPIKIANLAWTPVVFLFVDRIGRSPSLVRCAALASLLALQLTAGYPGFVLDSSLLVAAFACARWWNGEWALAPWKSLPLLAACFGVGALAAGIQVFPLIELISVSERAAVADSMAPIEQVFDRFALRHFGFPALFAFVIAGVVRPGIAVVGMLVTCLVLLMGAWEWLRFLPGHSSTRMPGTIPYLMQLPLAWLAASGAARAAANETRAWRWIAGGGVLWLMLCAGARFGVGTRAEEALSGYLKLSAGSEFAVPLLVLGGMGGLALAIAGRLPGPRRLPLALAGLCLLTGSQLLSFPGQRMMWPLPPHPSALRTSELLPARSSEVLAERGTDVDVGRVFNLIDTRGGYNMLDRIENPSGREGSLPPQRMHRAQRALAIDELVRLDADWKALANASWYLDGLDIDELVVPTRALQVFRAAGFAAPQLRSGGMSVLRNPGRIGRSWVSTGVVSVRSADEAWAAVRSADFDIHRQVVFEGETKYVHPRRSQTRAKAVAVDYPTPTRARMHVELERPGILVLADSCHPGWRVSVNGEPREIACANFLTRGVELPSGVHEVEFRYEPASLRLGIASSLVAGGSLIGILGAGLRRSHRSPL